MDPKAEEAIHHEREIRVICVGAGASGLCLAYKLQRSFRRFELTVSILDLPWYTLWRVLLTGVQIYEKNEEISGTWYENTYPG